MQLSWKSKVGLSGHILCSWLPFYQRWIFYLEMRRTRRQGSRFTTQLSIPGQRFELAMLSLLRKAIIYFSKDMMLFYARTSTASSLEARNASLIFSRTFHTSMHISEKHWKRKRGKLKRAWRPFLRTRMTTSRRWRTSVLTLRQHAKYPGDHSSYINDLKLSHRISLLVYLCLIIMIHPPKVKSTIQSRDSCLMLTQSRGSQWWSTWRFWCRKRNYTVY